MNLNQILEQLNNHNGINPKPDDYDDYWKRAKAEMKAVESNVEITKAKFESPIVNCYDMYFTGVNGARIYSKLLKPKTITGSCPAVIAFHGYNSKSPAWTELLPYAASGFVVAALDCRGQAGKSEDIGGHKGKTIRGHIIRDLEEHPDKLLIRDIFLDAAQLAGIVMDMEEVDENRVGVFGGSQGGALSIACAALEQRVKQAAPRLPFLCDIRYSYENGAAQNGYPYEELLTYFRENDPRHEREEEIFTKLGYIDVQFLAPKVKAEVLMFCSLKDPFCPPPTQYLAYNNMICDKNILVYPDYGHEPLIDASELTYQFMMKLLDN